MTLVSQPVEISDKGVFPESFSLTDSTWQNPSKEKFSVHLLKFFQNFMETNSYYRVRTDHYLQPDKSSPV
jgi:hypothetical protein